MSDTENAQAESEFQQHLKAARKAWARQWQILFPDEFWAQGRIVRRESLLAMRALVDRGIDHLERKERKSEAAPTPKPKPPSRPRKAKVVVE
jgi:hypothetical protein